MQKVLLETSYFMQIFVIQFLELSEKICKNPYPDMFDPIDKKGNFDNKRLQVP